MSSSVESSIDPIIGIVIPAYRSERFLPATLRSIQDQSFVSWECIVVDDGSPDDTAKAAEEFARTDPRIRVLRQQNAGVAAARNLGIRSLSKTVAFVTCMDSDDVYLSDALQSLLSALDAAPQAVAAHALAEFIDENGALINQGEFSDLGRGRLTCSHGRIVPVPITEPTTFDSVIISSTMFPPGLMLTRREIVDQLGGYDVAMTGAEDWDFLIRLCRLGDVRFIEKVILHYRRHGSNQGAGAHVREMCRRVWHKAFYSAENSAEHCRIVRESWRALQSDLIGIRLREARQCAGEMQIVKALLTLLRLPFIAFRLIRGYPTLGWL